MYIYIYIYTHISIDIDVYIYTYVHVYIHLHIYTYTYVHTYVYICTHILMSTGNFCGFQTGNSPTTWPRAIPKSLVLQFSCSRCSKLAPKRVCRFYIRQRALQCSAVSAKETYNVGHFLKEHMHIHSMQTRHPFKQKSLIEMCLQDFYMNIYIDTRARSHTHTYTHTCAHTQTCTHTNRHQNASQGILNEYLYMHTCVPTRTHYLLKAVSVSFPFQRSIG